LGFFVFIVILLQKKPPNKLICLDGLLLLSLINIKLIFATINDTQSLQPDLSGALFVNSALGKPWEFTKKRERKADKLPKTNAIAGRSQS